MFQYKLGLEIHVSLDILKKKLFCNCLTHKETCEICLGYPGSYPLLNKDIFNVIDIIYFYFGDKHNTENKLLFDRKHYIYKDLPKGYQITQYKKAFINEFFIFDKHIKKIQIEENPAQILNTGLLDYKRSGEALLEIVTYPIFENIEDSLKFINNLQLLFNIIGLTDSLFKIDLNISSLYDNKSYPRIEIKNITGIDKIKLALEYEIDRQKKILLENNEIKDITHTRSFNENKNITVFSRYKEEYFFIKENNIIEYDINIKNINNNFKFKNLIYIFENYKNIDIISNKNIFNNLLYFYFSIANKVNNYDENFIILLEKNNIDYTLLFNIFDIFIKYIKHELEYRKLYFIKDELLIYFYTIINSFLNKKIHKNNFIFIIRELLNNNLKIIDYLSDIDYKEIYNKIDNIFINLKIENNKQIIMNIIINNLKKDYKDYFYLFNIKNLLEYINKLF